MQNESVQNAGSLGGEPSCVFQNRSGKKAEDQKNDIFHIINAVSDEKKSSGPSVFNI